MRGRRQCVRDLRAGQLLQRHDVNVVRRVDMFALSHKVTAAPGRDVARYRATVFGGLLSILAIDLLAIMALYYILNYISFSNIVTNTFLGYVDSNNASGTIAAYAELPWLATLATPTLPAFRGLRVRVLAQGDPQRCAGPLQWSTPGGGSPWLLERSGGGVSATANASSPCAKVAGLNQFSFYCAECAFRVPAAGAAGAAATTLSLELAFTLHYSCQALVLEALAAGPAPASLMSFVSPVASLSRVTAPLDGTAGSAARGLLAGVNLTASALLGVVLDARGGAGGGQWGGGSGVNGVSNITGKGFLLSGGAIANASLYYDPTSATLFTPNSSAVAVRVTFVLDAVYSITTVGLRVNATALFVSLTSLLALFGLFNSLFSFAEEFFCAKRAEAAAVRAAAAAAAAAAASARRSGIGGGNKAAASAASAEAAAAKAARAAAAAASSAAAVAASVAGGVAAASAGEEAGAASRGWAADTDPLRDRDGCSDGATAESNDGYGGDDDAFPAATETIHGDPWDEFERAAAVAASQPLAALARSSSAAASPTLVSTLNPLLVLRGSSPLPGFVGMHPSLFPRPSAELAQSAFTIHNPLLHNSGGGNEGLLSPRVLGFVDLLAKRQERARG